MKTHKWHLLAISALLFFTVVAVLPMRDAAQVPPTSQLISDGALLAGLAPHALFPFIDATPNSVVQAHIAITDATSACAAGQAAPSNIQVLVGVAGGQLVNVMTAGTNTGIGSPAQCVFHVTIHPGVAGVPSRVTDIVVVNNSSAALSGVNTITVSAAVR